MPKARAKGKETQALPYAINLVLDSQGSLQVERLYVRLAELAVPHHDLVTQYGACVTILVVSDSVHPDDLREILGQRAVRPAALPVCLAQPCVAIGTPPTLALRVDPTRPLLEAHNAIYSRLPTAAVHLHYRPAHWQPHLKLCNVRQGAPGSARLVSAMAEGWQAIEATLDGIEVFRYPPEQLIWQAPLPSAPPSSPASP